MTAKQNTNFYRNLGIIVALTIFFTFTYFAATEYITAKKSKGEILLFQRDRHHQNKTDVEQPRSNPFGAESDEDLTSSEQQTVSLQKQTSVFQWKNICYDIKIEKEDRRILNKVDGWVAPGTLTALMVRISHPLYPTYSFS